MELRLACLGKYSAPSNILSVESILLFKYIYLKYILIRNIKYMWHGPLWVLASFSLL